MRRLEELLRQMCQASKAIGNTELENKFAEGISFVFSLSLFFFFLDLCHRGDRELVLLYEKIRNARCKI